MTFKKVNRVKTVSCQVPPQHCKTGTAFVLTLSAGRAVEPSCKKYPNFAAFTLLDYWFGNGRILDSREISWKPFKGSDEPSEPYRWGGSGCFNFSGYVDLLDLSRREYLRHLYTKVGEPRFGKKECIPGVYFEFYANMHFCAIAGFVGTAANGCCEPVVGYTPWMLSKDNILWQPRQG